MDTHKNMRGRPRGFDRNEVLDRVVELFWENGYRATTTRELETSLRLSQSSIYNTFGSKRELYQMALERYEARINERILRPLEESDDGLDAILSFFDNLAEWVTSDGKRGCMIVNMMGEDGSESGAIAKRTRAYRRRVREALAGALQRAVDGGESSDSALSSKADLLMGVVLGLNIAARGGATSPELEGLLTGVRMQINQWRED